MADESAVPMTEFPRDRDTICPPWCEQPADHANSMDYEKRKRLRAVAQIETPEIEGIRSGGEKPITLWLEAWVDWDWKEWPAEVAPRIITARRRSVECDERRAPSSPNRPASARSLSPGPYRRTERVLYGPTRPVGARAAFKDQKIAHASPGSW
jgi:hypothetical protein